MLQALCHQPATNKKPSFSSNLPENIKLVRWKSLMVVLELFGGEKTSSMTLSL
jgi:hypothetical protein